MKQMKKLLVTMLAMAVFIQSFAASGIMASAEEETAEVLETSLVSEEPTMETDVETEEAADVEESSEEIAESTEQSTEESAGETDFGESEQDTSLETEVLDTYEAVSYTHLRAHET